MYKFLGIHFKYCLRFMWPIKFLLRIKIFPMSLTKEMFQQRINDRLVIFIVPKMSILDIFVLNRALKLLNQPPIRTEANLKTSWHSSILALKSSVMFFQNKDKTIFVQKILDLIQTHDHSDDTKQSKFLFFPVSVYWSRSAERNEKGFLLRSLFPDDGTGNFLQKLFMLLLHRGEVSVSFGKEIEFYLPQTEQEELSSTEKLTNEHLNLLYAQRLQRQLLIEFAKERTTFLGPVLYEREKILQSILSSEQTKKFLIQSEYPEKTQHQIEKYIYEISANYRYATLRTTEQILDFVWTKVFTGIRVRNYEKIERLIRDKCVIWMPCHRSHFDYLLLNYLLFKHGAIMPHVAAGINLNFWPMGPFLRSGGAFFIRRSFSGNKTYTHTFAEYVNFLLHNSYPLEFFPEGGRSRIGKLLPPKLGMLSICLQSVMLRKAENTYLMPVSINYDKVMEDNTYAKELKGAKKQKENVLQFLNGIRKVFANYGSVDVSFGEPIHISQKWTAYAKRFELKTGQPFSMPEFKDLPNDLDTRDPKIQSFVKYLAYCVHEKINGAVTASSTALLSTVLLSYKLDKMPSRLLILYMLVLHYTTNELGKKLNWQIATSKTVDNVFEYISFYLNAYETQTESKESDLFSAVTALNDEYIKMGKTWGLLKEDTKGDEIFYSKNPEKEFNLWWYRGTTFNVFAIVGVLAKILISCERYQMNSLEVIFNQIRRLWRNELFWDDDTPTTQLIEGALHVLSELKVLSFDGTNIKIDKTKISLQNSASFSRENILAFFANIIGLEVELYGLLIAVGLFFIEKKRYFERHELLEKAFVVHEIAYKQNQTVYSGTFVKVFGHNVFDAIGRQNIFINTDKQRFNLDMMLIGSLSEFFDLNKWKNFLI